MFERKIV
jgi:hypothetical protein